MGEKGREGKRAEMARFAVLIFVGDGTAWTTQHPSLLYSFTRGPKPTFSTNPSHLNFSSILIELPS